MYRLVFTSLLLGLLCCGVTAQDTTIIYRADGNDTIIGRRSTDRYEYRSRHKMRVLRERWGMLDLGINIMHPRETYTLANGIDPFEQRLFKSTNLNIHFLRVRLQERQGHVGLEFGPSLEIFKYFFDNPVEYRPDQPQLTIDFVDGANYHKNRLTATYLTFPLMLSYRSNPRRPDRSLHMAFGIDAGILLGANYKTRLAGEKNIKTKDNFNLNQWRANLRAEFGIGPVQLYGMMGLNDLFDEDQNGGYEIVPYSFGFIIWPF